MQTLEIVVNPRMAEVLEDLDDVYGDTAEAKAQYLLRWALARKMSEHFNGDHGPGTGPEVA